MAVMHRDTFKIYHNDQNIVPEDFIDIDEWIAPTIQVLNQKGYTTRFCCSGHPLNDNWLFIDTSKEKGYYESGNFVRSYIMFEEGITLPSLPHDFTSTQNTSAPRPRLVIEKDHPVTSAAENQFFEKARRILETMKDLYEWALELPDFVPEKTEQDSAKPETAVEVIAFCNEKITEYGLNMKLIDAVYTGDRMKLCITYTSEESLDLRELVKALAMKFHCKIELHQSKE
ncbi:MAG: hypothetical protein IJP32_12655 [Clostridia bacterium]|nr:hypothetical protein [Clostridia bacterium]MBQ9997215.1 hypothetical protein [Clostridia bacterium]